MSASSESRWELTDTYSPAAIDSAPAINPATPAVAMALADAPAAATPSTRLAVETMPSLAPSTAARNQFERWLRCTSVGPVPVPGRSCVIGSCGTANLRVGATAGLDASRSAP